MGNLVEIKQRVEKLISILIELVIKSIAMGKETVPRLIPHFKKKGRNFIIGGIIGGIGAAVLAVGALYLVWALILLLDKAIEELWLSAMIVVGAMILAGGFLALIGLVITWGSARNIQKTVEATGKDVMALATGTYEEAMPEVTELQALGLREFKTRKRQVLDYLNIFYRLIPLGMAFMLLTLLVIRRRWKKRKKKKEALRAPVEVVFKED